MEIGFIVLPLIILATVLFALISRAYWIYWQLRKNGIKLRGSYRL
jgi:hypothetical protein